MHVDLSIRGRARNGSHHLGRIDEFDVSRGGEGRTITNSRFTIDGVTLVLEILVVGSRAKLGSSSLGLGNGRGRSRSGASKRRGDGHFTTLFLVVTPDIEELSVVDHVADSGFGLPGIVGHGLGSVGAHHFAFDDIFQGVLAFGQSTSGGSTRLDRGGKFSGFTEGLNGRLITRILGDKGVGASGEEERGGGE